MAKQKNAISPTRQEDYPGWFQEVIKAADLAESSDVRGCAVIKPWGYALWENIQAALDGMFKQTGHENAYFPLFIPLSFLEKEAEHVEGFAKECAVVTHHRLEPGPEGGLVPAAPLEEPLIVRPTSETIIGSTFARWVQSYRDLPILLNQWANVVRWEMRTRIFLRTVEFLWQEGHTVHATSEEAVDETKLILSLYAKFAQEWMAMPVICGTKTKGERFPGAIETYSIEAMMQDRKALQSGTSHFLGQNFAKAQEIKFQNDQEEEVYAWTTSWGVSTRLIGALVMTHSDDDGLIVPPRLAPSHIVLLPIYRNDEEKAEVLAYCDSLKGELESQSYDGKPVRVRLDDRDLRGGEKAWQWIKRGIPLRVEVGPRDVASGSVFVGRRDQGIKEKKGVPRDEFVATIASVLQEMQDNLFNRALTYRDENLVEITDFEEFKKYFTPKNAKKPEIHGGFAICHFVDCEEVDEMLKPLMVTPRCIPVEGEPLHRETPGKCIFTGQETTTVGIFGKSY